MVGAAARADHPLNGRARREVSVSVEQELGSGGKESAEAPLRNLAGFVVHADRVTGDKVSRAQPFAAQCEAGNVRLVRGRWNQDYLEELCAFPLGVLNDQVDASSGAFNKLCGGCTWTREDIRAYGQGMIVGPDGQWVTPPSLFAVGAEPEGAASEARQGDGGDWHKQWVEDVKAKNEADIKRLRRGW